MALGLGNLITLSRIFMAPLFAYLFFLGFEGVNSVVTYWTASLVLFLIEMSDIFDGYMARKTNTVTDFGKYLDPVADSMSRLTVFLAFLVTGLIPFWMYLIFLYRDLTVSFIRFICAKKGIVVSARPSGKIKAIIQGIAGGLVMVSVLNPIHKLLPIPEFIGSKHLAFYIMIVPAVYTAYSAFDYWNGTKEHIKLQ